MKQRGRCSTLCLVTAGSHSTTHGLRAVHRAPDRKINLLTPPSSLPLIFYQWPPVAALNQKPEAREPLMQAVLTKKPSWAQGGVHNGSGGRETIEDNHFLSPFRLFISFPEYDKLALNSGLFYLLFLLPGVLLHMVSSSLSW